MSTMTTGQRWLLFVVGVVIGALTCVGLLLLPDTPEEHEPQGPATSTTET